MSKDKKYNKKRLIKTVSFLKVEHKEMIEYISSLDDFSAHIRFLIERDMEERDEHNRHDIQRADNEVL